MLISLILNYKSIKPTLVLKINAFSELKVGLLFYIMLKIHNTEQRKNDRKGCDAEDFSNSSSMRV